MLPPVDRKDLLRRIDGPTYKVGAKCSNPNCFGFSDHAHHIVIPGKALRWDWIAIDGWVTGNMTGLCHTCHDDVHAGRAWIRWNGDERIFIWCLPGPKDELGKPTPIPVAPLRRQPPTPDTLANDDPQASDTQSGPESCPFCGQERKRRSPRTRVGRRKRKSWSVLVPDEKLEDGADVLDNLIANLAPLVPNADESATGRYYVLVAALAYSQISAVDFVESFRDAA